MVSVTGLKALNAQNTLDLFKTQQPPAKAATSTAAPTVQVGSTDRAKAIADLASKLIDIKSGAGDPESPSHVGDGKRPLSAAERETEKANFEAYYQALDDDDRANFKQKVTDLLLQNDLYKNDASFQAALRNGTLSVQSGDAIGFEERPREILFDDNGYYAGVKGEEVKAPTDLWSKIENVGGRLISKTDGQTVAIGQMNGMSFYVTWPTV